MIKEESKFSDSTIFEGMTSIRAVIFSIEHHLSDRKIEKIYLDASKTSKNVKEIGYLKAIQKDYGYQIEEVSAEFLDGITTGNSYGGIVAKCSERTLPSLNQLKNLPDAGFYIMIEGIEDPYNFGYAIRSFYACGIDGIILPKRNWMSAAGVVARSSAGASEMLPMYCVESPLDAVCFFHGNHYQVICAEEKTEHILGKCNLPLPILLVVGGEKRGITKNVLDLADMKVKIPYGRQFKASLSAASASTIFAYEISRQNNIYKE